MTAGPPPGALAWRHAGEPEADGHWIVSSEMLWQLHDEGVVVELTELGVAVLAGGDWPDADDVSA